MGQLIMSRGEGEMEKGVKRGGRAQAKRVEERGEGTSGEWEDKEESGKGHGVHPRCFLMWPSQNSGSPSFPHYSVRHALCSQQVLCALH